MNVILFCVYYYLRNNWSSISTLEVSLQFRKKVQNITQSP